MGLGGLGIIRLSGEKAVEITNHIFTLSTKKSLLDAKSHTLHHGYIKNNGQTIDEVVVSVFKSPNSYTTEDVIEISAHGGPVILKEILELCLASGARLAHPGEFTFRAFINGRMDLTKAEAVCDLIASKTSLAAQASIRQLEGSLAGKISEWRNEIVSLLSRIEASLDHGEEELPFVSNKEITDKTSELLIEIEKIENSASKGKYLRQGLKLAIIGKPNTGKSSLLNALLEKDRAIVTEHPGTTRDVIEEMLDIEGIPVVIMDTAGIRNETTDPIEKLGQERTYNCIKNADLILWLMDSSTELTQEDKYIAGYLSSLYIKNNVIIALNKCDLKQKLIEQDLKSIFSGHITTIKISALKGTNLRAVEDAVLSFFKNTNTLLLEPFLINERHMCSLKSSQEALQKAMQSAQKGEGEELTAINLREALGFLGEITGENVTEEILDNIFSKFCIGK